MKRITFGTPANTPAPVENTAAPVQNVQFARKNPTKKDYILSKLDGPEARRIYVVLEAFRKREGKYALRAKTESLVTLANEIARNRVSVVMDPKL